MSGECVIFRAFRTGVFVGAISVSASTDWVVEGKAVTWWESFEERGVAKRTADFLSGLGVVGGVFESGRPRCELVVVGKVIEN